MDDLDKASDQDLLDLLKRRRKRLGSIHLGPILLAPVVAALAWRPLGLIAAAGLGAAVLVGGLWIVLRIARRLSASPLELLAFERGLHVRLSPEGVERRMSGRLKDVDGPRCVLHLQGAVLPHGGCVSVELRIGDEAAELEVRATSFRAEGVMLKRASLGVDQVRSLRDRIEAEFLALQSAERFPVRDGFPCDLAIGLRDPVRLRRFECNLAGPSRPVVEVARALWALASPLLELPWIMGACGPNGEIQIRRV